MLKKCIISISGGNSGDA